MRRMNAGLHLAFDVIAAVYGLMSAHDPDSDVSRLNRAAPGAVLDIDPRSAVLLVAALALARQGDGLSNLFSAPKPVEWAYLPAQDWTAPSSALARDGCRLMKPVPAWIALGAIAKGGAVAAAVTSILIAASCRLA
jgi:thiamine biosynthesis lipoprotein